MGKKNILTYKMSQYFPVLDIKEEAGSSIESQAL